MRLAGITLAVLFLFTEASFGEEAKKITLLRPSIELTVSKKEDRVSLEIKDGKAYCNLTSDIRIGGMGLKLNRGTWPETLTLSTNFNSLESFAVSTDKLAVNGELQSGGFSGARGKDERGLLSVPMDVKFEMPIKLVNGRVEIIIPLKAIAGTSQEVKIGWIDAFRK